MGDKKSYKTIRRSLLLFLASILMFVLYFIIYTQVFGFKTPRTLRLEHKNLNLHNEKEVLQSRLQEIGNSLILLKERDENVYRTIFGLPLNPYVGTDSIKGRIEWLYQLAYNQSVSYDTIAPIAENITKMTQCVPSIPPVNPTKVTLTSHFGVRSDPMAGDAKVHWGVDLAGPDGQIVVATGDGKIIEANVSFTGYGNEVIIEHGFGYQTRYAHLKRFIVHQGQYVRRGEQIGFLGTSGKSTGSHLHYEVLYMNNRVNPINFFDISMSDEEFKRIISVK